MKRKYLFLLSIFVFSSTKALTLEQRLEHRHEVSVGYGEQLCDAFSPKGKLIGMVQPRHYFNQKITGNIYAEYMYQINKLISFGINFNFNAWKSDYKEDAVPIFAETGNYGHNDSRIGTEKYYTYSFLPTIRFTYFNHPNVNLYSGLSIGATMFGTVGEISGMLALDVCALGVAFGDKQWFGNVEVGALCSSLLLVNFLPTRIVSVGLGYRF